MEEVRSTIILLGGVLAAFVIVTKYEKIKAYIKWLFNRDD